MKLSEWIGFIISIGAFLFLVYNQLFGGGRKKNPEQERRLKEFLAGLKQDMGRMEEQEEEEYRPLPRKVMQPPPPLPKPVFHKEMARSEEPRAMPPKSKKRRLPSGKQMILIRELLDTPRAYRPWTTQHF